MNKKKLKIFIGMATCGRAAGAQAVLDAVKNEVAKKKLMVEIIQTGCIGMCSKEVLLDIVLPGKSRVTYGNVTPQDVALIFSEHIKKGMPVKKLIVGQLPIDKAVPYEHIACYDNLPFMAKQKRQIIKRCGVINPEKIDDYLAHEGYQALPNALKMSPEAIIKEMEDSGLRGRGGGGFLTGLKWKMCASARSDTKYMICNADEGDPGAFMDRSLLESDPHSVIEGMIIGCFAVGAAEGYIYVRSEYPLAVERLKIALKQAEEHGFLGENILGSGFNCDIKIKKGSGAFVCGEETALMASIEGKRGMPKPRPPFPAECGLWGKPTNINNVETFANVPLVILEGGKAYAQTGTEKSKGTKIFALTGKVNNTGMIEVPMGITIREIVFDIGQGIAENKKFKAVQIGGPSGGCLGEANLDTPIDYDSLTQAGAIMGSGGCVVIDEDTCMVDIARYFMDFIQNESCGKCIPCRIGTKRMLEILTRICDGKGSEKDLILLEEVANNVKALSLCGLGKTSANPILSTLRYFKNEYIAHIKEKRCPAAACKGLISSPCQYLCPLNTDVPAYNTLTAKGQFKEALELIRKTNPLPIVCGRVCMAMCKNKCRAKESQGAIGIRELKRFLTDYEISSMKNLPIRAFSKKYKEKIAIIGSGPAGLTAGYYLAQKGYEVTIFEALSVIGGMLAVGIPEYRLPKKLLQAEINIIKKSGVNIKTNSPVNNLDNLFKKSYAAVFIATGAHKSLRLGIPGEDTKGVMDPIVFLRKVNLKEKIDPLGKRVGIIGGGNTAIDAARTALRLGAKEVIMLYRRTRAQMPAAEEEIEAALEEGVRIKFLVQPKRIISENGRLKSVECIRCELGNIDSSGRRSSLPITGSEFMVELDTLIPAIAQQPDLSFIPAGYGLEISRANTLICNPETLTTNKKGIFAGGDAASGPLTATDAIASGKIAAESIHQYLRKKEIKRNYQPVRPSIVIEPIKIPEEEFEKLSPQKMPKLKAKKRKDNFDEVETGYTEKMAIQEAKRCLRCDWQKEIH